MPARMAAIQKSTSNKCFERVWKKEKRHNYEHQEKGEGTIENGGILYNNSMPIYLTT